MLVANPIAYDGRVMRHAQTLVNAGHQVTVLGVIGPNDRDTAMPADLSFQSWRLDRRRTGILPRMVWASTALRQRTALHLMGPIGEGTLSRLPGVAELAVATSALELLAKAVLLPSDVFHANDLNTLPAAAWAARLSGRPYVYDAHELYVDEYPTLSQAERRARAAAERRLCPGAAAVLTVNDLIADELARLYPIGRPVVVRNVPNLVDIPDPATRPLGAAGSLRLLYHGANVGLAQHGTDDVLRAMARVRDRVDVHLTIRGGISTEEQGRLLLRIGELELLGRVRIAPPVSGAGALVAAAVAEGEEIGLAVHPPLCQSYRYTTSSKVYEYQVAGLAVCATDIIGNRQSADEHAAVFYPPGDDEKLAALFVELAFDRARLRAMQRAARERALRELCWEHEQARLLAVYERLRTQAGSKGS